eukprot:GHVT01087764.1.p1 GENE.GHVT01087764.1~~GHVT01087764.1.p1  ORF type:complete len:174 (+),score=13.57 GHVT01087764.1:434-955(+)
MSNLPFRANVCHPTFDFLLNVSTSNLPHTSKSVVLLLLSVARQKVLYLLFLSVIYCALAAFPLVSQYVQIPCFRKKGPLSPAAACRSSVSLFLSAVAAACLRDLTSWTATGIPTITAAISSAKKNYEWPGPSECQPLRLSSTIEYESAMSANVHCETPSRAVVEIHKLPSLYR